MKLQLLDVSFVLCVAFAMPACDDYDAYPGGLQSGAQGGELTCIMPAGTTMPEPPAITPGAPVVPESFWGDETYDPAGAPATLPPSGHHMGMTCMPCHSAGSTDVDAREFPWAFAGTVRQSPGGPGQGNVQIGIRQGGVLYATYTSSGGHFWLPNGPASWAGAEVRMRSGGGERVMAPRSDMTGDCNECHGPADKNLVAPE